MAGAKIGGAEGFFERLCVALANAGTEQHAAIRTHDRRARLLAEAGIPVTEMRFGGKLDILTGRRLNTLARSFQPDVALAWMSRGASFMPSGPFVKTARLGGYYDLKYFRRCDHLIGNTPDLRDYLIQQGWPTEKSWYLPNFVDDRALPAQDRAALDTPEDAPLILCLGRLHRNKGFDTALHSLADLPGAYLWIAGEGPERDALTRQAEDLGLAPRVRFLGWRNDVPALLAAADIFLCSSRHEPLGNMVIEAWAHGVPVAAAASQGPSQLIQDGINGLLAPIDDAAALAKAADSLIKDGALAQELAGAGNAAYRGQYTEGHVVQQYQDFFDQISTGGASSDRRGNS
ncbi:glycosyltransferase [Hwanghaeella grinnelliae]|uniref:Glycosyltransferase n=1 Tax=Hwanghaeella grinnelliae TaxID=2500179 RepID=A0A3S2Z5S3_9PROT|nr:glycosyltransferase [Hwanghaeella grinnelliae]RVU34750.1 glycosyltransferase [Hwanghaeella grinnelliae]